MLINLEIWSFHLWAVFEEALSSQESLALLHLSLFIQQYLCSTILISVLILNAPILDAHVAFYYSWANSWGELQFMKKKILKLYKDVHNHIVGSVFMLCVLVLNAAVRLC